MTFGTKAEQFVVSADRREVRSVEFGCVQCTQVMPTDKPVFLQLVTADVQVGLAQKWTDTDKFPTDFFRVACMGGTVNDDPEANIFRQSFEAGSISAGMIIQVSIKDDTLTFEHNGSTFAEIKSPQFLKDMHLTIGMPPDQQVTIVSDEAGQSFEPEPVIV